MSDDNKEADAIRARMIELLQANDNPTPGGPTPPINECIKGCAKVAKNIQEYENCVASCKSSFPKVIIRYGEGAITVGFTEEAEK